MESYLQNVLCLFPALKASAASPSLHQHCKHCNWWEHEILSCIVAVCASGHLVTVLVLVVISGKLEEDRRHVGASQEGGTVKHIGLSGRHCCSLQVHMWLAGSSLELGPSGAAGIWWRLLVHFFGVAADQEICHMYITKLA